MCLSSQLKLSEVSAKLESADLIFAVPQKGVTVKQLFLLRNSLPPGSSTMVVKNKLMNRWVKPPLHS